MRLGMRNVGEGEKRRGLTGTVYSVSSCRLDCIYVHAVPRLAVCTHTLHSTSWAGSYSGYSAPRGRVLLLSSMRPAWFDIVCVRTP